MPRVKPRTVVSKTKISTSADGMVKSKNRMEEVYQKAAKLFSEQGFVRTTMQDIAQELKIQKGSLYYYVTDKDTLLFDILDRTMDALIDTIQTLSLEHLPTREKMAVLIHRHFRNVVMYKYELSLFMNVARNLSAKQRKHIENKRRTYEEVFLKVIEEGISNGTFIRHNPHQVAFFILGGIYWFFQWFSPEEMASQAVTEESFINVFFNGLLKDRQQ